MTVNRFVVSLALLGALTPYIDTVEAQQAGPITISKTNSRPLEALIGDLEQRYGWIVTFEDPPYEAASDLDDITLEAAKEPGTKTKVLAPRRRTFTPPAATETNSGSSKRAPSFMLCRQLATIRSVTV
jgi:hypothetical protein